MGFRAHVAPALAIFTSCCACTFTRDKKDDEHLAVQEHAEQQLAEHEQETKQTGPETITTTIEEYDDDDPGSDSGTDGGVAGGGEPRGAPDVARRATVAPHLIKRTVVVDQRGPVVDTKTREAQEAGSEDVGLDMTRHIEVKTKDAPALAGWLWIALAVAAVAGVGWAAWKFSLPGKVVSLAQKLLR